MEPLSRRQKDVLSILEDFLANQGFPPSIREIACRLGLTGTVSVVQHLNALERKGYIRRSRASSRGIALTPDGVDWKQELLPGVDWENTYHQLPVVEQVSPNLQEPDDEETVCLLSCDRFAKMSGTRFMLKVQGDAMRGAGILEGDLALVRPHPEDAANNDIVVVWLNGDTLVRRCLHEQGFIRLQPENQSFDPIFVRHGAAGFHIIGTVIGIFRMFRPLV
jgi:repressor LexA